MGCLSVGLIIYPHGCSLLLVAFLQVCYVLLDLVMFTLCLHDIFINVDVINMCSACFGINKHSRISIVHSLFNMVLLCLLP